MVLNLYTGPTPRDLGAWLPSLTAATATSPVCWDMQSVPSSSRRTFGPPGTRTFYQPPVPPSTAAPELSEQLCLHASFIPAPWPCSGRQPAGWEQRGDVPGRAAHRGAAVEAGEPQPSGSHAVQVGRGRRRVPVAPQVPEAQVVRQQQDEAGRGASHSTQGRQHQGPRQGPAPRPHGAGAWGGPAAPNGVQGCPPAVRSAPSPARPDGSSGSSGASAGPEPRDGTSRAGPAAPSHPAGPHRTAPPPAA